MVAAAPVAAPTSVFDAPPVHPARADGGGARGLCGAQIPLGGHLEAVRRGWEQGETAASLARRYDVGLANLWRRRAAEGWERRLEKDPSPEPLEGWKMYAERRLDEFEARVAETRDLAQRLLRIMQGEELNEVPTWHMGYLVVFRAEHLGPESAAADRERFRDRDWAPAVWDEAGRFRPQYEIDRRLLLMHRKEWREEVGLPDGVAEDYP